MGYSDHVFLPDNELLRMEFGQRGVEMRAISSLRIGFEMTLVEFTPAVWMGVPGEIPFRQVVFSARYAGDFA